MKIVALFIVLSPLVGSAAFAGAADAAYSLGFTASPGLPYGPVYSAPAREQAPVFGEDTTAHRHARKARRGK